MTANEKSSICYFLGKLSDDPEDIDWIQTIFKHKQARTKSEIIKVDQWRKRYKTICKKKSYNKWYIIMKFEKKEECGREKEKANFDFTIDESCIADKNIPCDLYKNEIEKMQKELIAYKAGLI